MAGDERVSALRATAHPVRLRMLSLLTGTAMSAAEVARELDLTHANASYHLRRLVEAGELIEAGEEKIRGGVAKRYRYPHERRGEPDNPTKPTADDRAFYARAVGLELERRIALRQRGSRGSHTDLEGWVPPEVWARAVATLEEVSAMLHDANRAPRSDGTVHVSYTAWAFLMRADEPGHEEGPS